MKISVVVPTFNRANMIGETLDAILAQSVAPDEVIVVDDGSEDDTPGVLARYGERVRSIRIQNSGDMVARNRGLHAARSRLVAFCDSDDLWTEHFLGDMLAQWCAEPTLVACYSDFRILQNGVLSERTKFDNAPGTFWEGLRPIGVDAGVFDRPIVERLQGFQPFFTSCLVVSRAAFHALGGWDEGVSRVIGCDFATVIRLAAQPSIGVVRRALVTVRKHPGNISSDTEKMNLGDARVLEHVLHTRPELLPLEIPIRRSVALRRSAALDSAFSRRDFGTVREIYRLLPPNARAAKQRMKFAIASSPLSLGTAVAALVSR